MEKKSEDPVRHASLQTAHPRAGALYSALEQGRTADEQDSRSMHTALGVNFVDIEIGSADRATVRFAFRGDAGGKWEGIDYVVELRQLSGPQR
jgi:hypothetical protein